MIHVDRSTYTPFGERLAVTETKDKSYYLSTTYLTERKYTNRGFTGHEHIEEMGLIHMNGRVYDPTIGRFLSADPHIQAPGDTQSYNRYSYVKNNPLKYTDPSGYFFKKLFKIAVVIAAAVVTAGVALAAVGIAASVGAGITAVATGGIATLGASSAFGAFGAAVIAGAGMGFGAGFAGGLVNGASVGQSFKMGLNGAKWGAISAGVAYGVAELAGVMTNVNSATAHAAGFGSFTGRVKAVMHGLSRVAIAKHQYGTTKGAFASAFFTSSVGSMIGGGRFGAVKAAMVGGTASVIGGGKFANGAIGSAFQYMFNDSIQSVAQKESDILDMKVGRAFDKYVGREYPGSLQRDSARVILQEQLKMIQIKGVISDAQSIQEGYYRGRTPMAHFLNAAREAGIVAYQHKQSDFVVTYDCSQLRDPIVQIVKVKQ
jgi:RHS repeat-associated protein